MTTRTFHIPVVAGREAGKTVFMMAAVASLKSLEQADPPAFEFANPDAEKDYLRAQSVLQRAIESQFELQKDAFSGIASTLPAISVQAFNIYIGPEGSSNRRLVYLYDAAGERYQTSEGVATFRFLGHTEGVVLIVDPFSFEAVRRVVKADVLTGLRHSQADADEVFSRFAQTLRESLGSKTTRKITASLAVVLTKCDGLLAISEVKHPYDELGDAATNRTQRTIRSDAVRSWLESVAGQHGLVTALENTFERYGYFAVSALDAFTVESRASGRTRAMVSNDDTRDPILWLLNKREAK